MNRAQGKVSPFTKKKCGIDVVLNHVVKIINEKRGAIFDIYLQRKKESQKYCVKFFDSFSKKVCAGTTQFFF